MDKSLTLQDTVGCSQKCADGRFPPDFRTTKTVEEVKVIDPTALDRILRAYVLTCAPFGLPLATPSAQRRHIPAHYSTPYKYPSASA